MLQFENPVHEIFDSLAAAQGLKPAMTSPTAARYESDSVFMQLLFDPDTKAVVVEVGQKSGVERPFGLVEILKMHNSPDASFLNSLSPVSQEGLVHAIGELRKFVEKFALPLLKNDLGEFQKIQAFRKNACLEKANPKDLRAIRAEAKAALDQGHLLAYIKSMRSIEIVLTASEKQALAKAEKQVLWG